MEDETRYQIEYKKRMRHNWLMLFVQVGFVLFVIIFSLASAWSGLYLDARKTSMNADARVKDITEGYENVFKTLVIPIEEQIEADVSLEEMQAWLQEREPIFRDALGADVYDGIALTYKGGYARSWTYGDYSAYDPTTRPWYLEAQEANGEVTVTAPYMTYLATVSQATDADILMTVCQKYNDEISFDLDLKLPKIKQILDGVTVKYSKEQIFVFNKDGQVLSSTQEEVFGHNVFNPDDVITSGLSRLIKENMVNDDQLLLENIDGVLCYMYFLSEGNGSTIVTIVPAMQVFLKDFLMISIASILLIAFVIVMFLMNRTIAKEFIERDRRLETIENSEQRERLYVNVDQLTFYGNYMAKDASESNNYDSLYQLIKSRIVDEADYESLRQFLSVDAVKRTIRYPYLLEKRRFLMNMKAPDGTLKPRTIEMRRMGFVQNGVHMMELAMLDAAESVDLLKQALHEASRLKEEKEDEYNRFMSYICRAEDGVEELNIAKHTITRYFVKNETLQQVTVDYPGMPFELFHEDDREKAHELYDESKLAVLCAQQSASYAELRMKWDNHDEYHWCNVIVQGLPITDNTPFNVLVLIKDTNEIKLKEIKQREILEDAFRLAEEGSKAKGSFLSNMSHEIRTPLNAIIGYLTIAKDPDCTIEKKDYCIENCDAASRHLLQIINDVLDMSSIENGKLKISHEEFDLKKEIGELTTIFYQNAKAKAIHFETHIENVTEEWVTGDPLRLNQVLMNLLSNAVKFTPEHGHVTLTMEQLRKDAQKVYMKFTVQDTGIGMSKEYMSRIFHPFEQEDATTAKRFGGSGLGLSITNNLVQLMGGKIDVQSVQNQGTTFEVTMFFDLATGDHQKEVVADYSHVRVLVVDDKENECSYVKTMLKRCGAKADTVTSGEAALKRIRSRQGGDYAYDLCIIDWSMPNMNGCEVTRRIREELGEHMPIIIATAYDITEFEDEAKRAGANRIIAKPLFQSTLFDILVSNFGNYQPDANATTDVTKVDLSGVRVLLAEDNPMNMDIAVTILEKSGVQVDPAKDGKEAVELFLKSEPGTYNLILMDVQMPVMDGYEATSKIRESNHPEAKTIPIIAMTANAFAEDVAEALSRGMNAHIAKPINYDKLYAILKQYSK